MVGIVCTCVQHACAVERLRGGGGREGGEHVHASTIMGVVP